METETHFFAADSIQFKFPIWELKFNRFIKFFFQGEKAEDLEEIIRPPISMKKIQRLQQLLQKFSKYNLSIPWFIFQKQPQVFCKKRCSQKVRKIQKKTLVPESLFYKVAGPRPSTLLKKRLQHRCFPVNFTKFLRTPF